MTKIVAASDLQNMTFPPVRHILPGYISEGATIIAGKPKVGKSWLTLDLCLAATANRFTLGTLKPAQGDVLYLALEDNKRRLKKRMGKLWPSSDARWPTRLALVTDWKRADEGGLEDIEEWCNSVADPVMANTQISWNGPTGHRKPLFILNPARTPTSRLRDGHTHAHCEMFEIS